MDDSQYKNNNEENEYEEEVEIDQFDEEDDKKSEDKMNNKYIKEKKTYNIYNNNINQKKIDDYTNTTNEEKRQYNDKDIKETKSDYNNEIIENNKEKISLFSNDKISKNSFENTSQNRLFREEKNEKKNYLNESDSNLNKSVRLKLIGLNNNKNKKKVEKMEKDLEQLKWIKEIYINEIIKLRKELDIANIKLIKETKDKNNLLNLYDEVINKLNSYGFKFKNTYDISKFNYNGEDLIKLIELKECEYKNLKKENMILKADIKKLKSEIKQYNLDEKVELFNENLEKDRQITELKKLNEEYKRSLDELKYENMIENLNKKMDEKEDLIKNLNNKLNSLSIKIREKENKIKKGINIRYNNINNINNYSAKKINRNINPPICERYLRLGLKKNKSEIFRPRSNFNNSYCEKENNSINNLLELNKELNNLNAKIENIEKRNRHYERMLKNENSELIMKNRINEEMIKELNEKEKENLKRINDYKMQFMTNKSVNNKLEKIIKRKDETESINRELLKRKEEEIQKLLQEKIKLTEAIQKNKKDITRVNKLKRKDEDLKSFKDELGEINEIDNEQNKKQKKNMFSSSLLVQKNDDIYFKGLSSMDNVLESQDKNEELN